MKPKQSWEIEFDKRFYEEEWLPPNVESEYVEIKRFIQSELLRIKTEIESELEKNKGNGTVISGSPGPMYDWGCTQGYDLALIKAKEIISKIITSNQ